MSRIHSSISIWSLKIGLVLSHNEIIVESVVCDSRTVYFLTDWNSILLQTKHCIFISQAPYLHFVSINNSEHTIETKIMVWLTVEAMIQCHDTMPRYNDINHGMALYENIKHLHYFKSYQN